MTDWQWHKLDHVKIVLCLAPPPHQSMFSDTAVSKDFYSIQMMVKLLWTYPVMLSIFIFSHTHTHTRLMALCPGLPGWAGTRKVNPIWILLKQETVSGSGITWAICKSAPRSRQITMPAPHHSVFYRPDALPAAQPTASKHYSLFRQVMLFPIWYSPASCTSWFWFLLCFYLQDHHSEEFISPIAGYEIGEAEAGSRL